MAASPSGALAAGELAQLHFARIARLRAAAPRAAFRFGADGNNMIEVALTVLPGGAIGSVVWRGAVVLCELLARRRALVAGRRVLELGAGVGLVALVAARLGAASVLATDAPGAEDVLRLLRQNAAEGGGAAAGSGAAAAAEAEAAASAAEAAAAAAATEATEPVASSATTAAVVRVAALAWGAATWPGGGEAADADLVLAADVVYEPTSALLLAETLARALPPNAGGGRSDGGSGTTRECLMSYKERGAGEIFFAALRANGLACTAVDLNGEHTVFRIARRE
jgi:predicted nicotinamide N-methyase